MYYVQCSTKLATKECPCTYRLSLILQVSVHCDYQAEPGTILDTHCNHETNSPINDGREYPQRGKSCTLSGDVETSEYDFQSFPNYTNKSI